MSTAAQGVRPARLREILDGRREWMGNELYGGTSAIAACAGLSDAYDAIVSDLWREAGMGCDADSWSNMAVVATGGWGRREMCPFSDIDILLLAPSKLAPVAREAAEKLLYPLWDAGIRVGHAVRDPAETARLARGDLATATALLDARLVTGDVARFEELMSATRRAVAPGGNPNQFIARLAAEKEKRHDRFGDSLYLLEPNLKQGIGALRDLATAIWAAQARWSVSSLSELVSQGNLTARQAAAMSDGLDFLLRLRSLLQLHAGRATDQLTFEIQEAVAPRLYPDAQVGPGEIKPAVAPAVEALMRRYYLHARSVLRVADRLLEAARVPARRKPRMRRVDASFLLWNGKLAVSDPDVFVQRPSEVIRLFRVALDQDVPIYRHTLALIEDKLATGAVRLTGDPAASRMFLAALCDLRDVRQPSLLEEMHQVGVLGQVMPEFAPCTCRVQHDLYHVYTVDQHQLYAVAMLKRTMRGDLADEAPLATEVARSLEPSPALFLGTLLHDVGKPLGKGHAEKGAQAAGVIARRFGLGDDDAQRIELLVRQHLTMSHLSQRRDLTDPEVIRRFAERIGDEETLAQLYLLTRCDTAMTAPGNLNAWKDQLLGELYTRARDWFRGRESRSTSLEGEPHEVIKRTAELLRAEAPEMVPLVEHLDERLLLLSSPRQLVRHLLLADKRVRNGSPVELEVVAYPLKGHTQVQVVADDQPGLLAIFAGVLAAHRVNIDAAVVATVEPPGAPALAFDRFYVRDPYGQVIEADDPRWQHVAEDLAEVLASGAGLRQAVADLIRRRRKTSALAPRVTPGVPTVVQEVEDASENYTVIEVATRDRVGLLHTITRTLAELGLDIHLAKVSTEGAKANDAFYVRDGAGNEGKLVDPERRRRILAALTAAVEAEADE